MHITIRNAAHEFEKLGGTQQMSQIGNRSGYLKRAQPMFCKRMRHAALGYHGSFSLSTGSGRAILGGMHTAAGAGQLATRPSRRW